MKINPNIFRAYDIRGVYPSTLNEETTYLIGRAFVKFLGKKKAKIVVGRDSRLSSPSLFKALTKGIMDEGADVVDIGLSMTPMFYFAVAHFGFDGGLNITASHNPRQYNGFKLVREGAFPIGGETGIETIKDLVLKGEFGKAKKGRIIKKEVLKEYIRFNLKGHDLKKIRRFRIVIDTANAVPGLVMPEFFKKINCKIYHIYSKLDGNFPNHAPDPHTKENLQELQRQVLAKKADMGIAFDGDGDRIIFVDERGSTIGGDFITALITAMLLKNNPGEKIFYDIRSSKIVKEVIEELGGKVVIARLGHSFIKAKMRKENILFAGELNGHYYHRNHYFCEAPLFVILKILEEISETGKDLSALIKPFKKYSRSKEINFKVKDKMKRIKELGKRYRHGKVSYVDGVRVDFKDWWFSVRASNTEDLLRLNLEAESKELFKEKKKELITFIEK